MVTKIPTLAAEPGQWHPSSLAVARGALSRQLPARYDHEHRQLFDAHARPLLRPGSTILDVGAGRTPTFPPSVRPPGCTYIGLDLSPVELAAAPPGSYEDAMAGDVSTFVPELANRFDAIFSWQVLEHVRPLPEAMENLRHYLRPGGQLVAHFSGTFGLFGLLSRVVPDRLTPALLERLFSRPRCTTFPAHYDRCWASALSEMGRPWSSFDIVPRHEGARYFAFSRHVQAAYLAYEEWAGRKGIDNLASYYLVVAAR
jgi:SAM-dependent methyltransferase